MNRGDARGGLRREEIVWAITVSTVAVVLAAAVWGLAKLLAPALAGAVLVAALVVAKIVIRILVQPIERVGSGPNRQCLRGRAHV